MATFQDTYANADYIASLLSGQVAGGYLEKKASEAAHGFWRATSTNLGANFSASAITGVSYTPNQSAGTVGRLQFSTDGSNVKAIDGSNIDVGAYDFDLLEYINIPKATAINDMYVGGMTFSVWINPETGAGTPNVWYKGYSATIDSFLFYISSESATKYKINWAKRTNISGATPWSKVSTDRPISAGKWNHVVGKWSGVLGDDPVIYVNGVLVEFAANSPVGTLISDAAEDLKISSPIAGNNYVGTMSDLIFWTSELTATQMKEIYLYSKIPAGFVARYRLADTTTAVDGVIIDDTTNHNGALKCTNS